MKTSLFLPPELWDLILSFVELENLEKFKIISNLFQGIIALNKDLRISLILYRNISLDRYRFLTYQFDWAIKDGNLEILQWLHSKNGKLKIEEIMECIGFWPVSKAAEMGYLDIVKWLYNTFNFASKIYNMENVYLCTFLSTIGKSYNVEHKLSKEDFEESRLKVLKWFHLTFSYTRTNILQYIERPFRHATENGDLKILKWLQSTFDLRLEDIAEGVSGFGRPTYNYSFIKAAGKGNLEILKWMYSTFNMTVENSKCDYDCALR